MAQPDTQVLSPIVNSQFCSRSSPSKSFKTPCISLKKINSSDKLIAMATTATPSGGISLRSSNVCDTTTEGSPMSPSSKLTGNPGYVFFDQEAQSPVKVHPTNPRHVRGGSISSDMSEVPSAEQIIPMQPCEQEILVPLLHRHQEMKQLIAANPAQFVRLQAAMSADTYTQLLHLWTEVTRAALNDNDWLLKTRSILDGRSSPNWSMWCDMVGFCEQTHPLVSAPPSPSITTDQPPHNRRSSTTSLLDDTIEEEEEDS